MQTPKILAPGFRIMIRHWPALAWTYVAQLGIAIVFSLRIHAQFGDILNHSLAAQRLNNGFDLGVVLNTFSRLGEGPSGGPATPYAGVPLYILLYVLLTAGTLFVYQETAERARLSTLLSTGLRYFWRFIRLLLISAPITLLILAPLSALRGHWLTSSDEHGVIEKALFMRGAVTSAFLLLIASALRLYFDLTEVYTIQLGLRGDRRIRKSLKPAWRAFRSCLLPAYGSFLVIAVLGVAAFALFAWAAALHLPTPFPFFLFLLSQIAMFLLLAARFWQRGMETALALALPIPEPSAIAVPIAQPVVKPIAEHDLAAVADPIPDPEPEPPYFPPPAGDQSGEYPEPPFAG